MRHAPEIQTDYKGTMAMEWVIKAGTNPPEWMWHNPRIRDNYGKTIRDYWGNRPNIPEWMIYKIFTEMKIGCLHIFREVVTSSNLIVCSDCGNGVKVFCNSECPICRVEFEKGNIVALYNVCKHVFCRECAESWRKQSTRCPFCRKENDTIPDDEVENNSN
jgi:hypothetical protein